MKMYVPYKQINSIAICVAVWFLTACGGGGGTSTTTTPTSTTNLSVSVDRNITINNAVQIEPLGKASIRVDVNITNGPKDLYILLSNYDTVVATAPQIAHNPKIAVSQAPKNLRTSVVPAHANIIHAPAEVEAFRQNIRKILVKANNTTLKQAKILNVTTVKQEVVVGATNNFQLNATAGLTTAATARKVVSNIVTVFGSKTLNIWVSDDSFDAGFGCQKTNCVTQAMVDIFANKFLTAGANNDIYDWVTNIFGEEWNVNARTQYTNLIPYDGNITILLTDIQNDNSTNGGVLGYFYGKDNFTTSTYSGSNQRIMFYMDSVLFATPDAGAPWAITHFWPAEMISTLAHEFQHMIHFYQKQVNFGVQSQTWLNEMLSETTEDVVATKLQLNGPRNVVYTNGTAGGINTGGRYPLFNQYNSLTLPASTGSLDSNGNPTFSLADYSKVSAFGTFLTRNYGGSKVLHDIVYNNLTGTDAVTQAIQLSPQGAGKTFNNMLTEWGEAVFLSDRTNLVNMPTYNTGAFTPDIYNGVQYDLGSINFFNYLPSVTINTTSGTVNPQGNYYYKVGTGLNGLVQIEVLLNGTTEATLIAK